ncbi:MAG TPA: 50S ribosomal protein L19 [Myxococcota bacterium]|jgi:large subunit ribosomal protein L19|nr:50S ribosomal protein L19 [Myxococcota bacterium]HND34579.1 50S ribosomal protein L19 [Myxococcota bacterium]
MNLLQTVEQENITKRDVVLRPGDEVRVHVRIKDGEKVRIQVYEGTIISMKGTGTRSMFTVRKVSFGVGVERIFPLYSPTLEKVEVKVRHAVRRSRLYFLRGRFGKAARLKEVTRN